MIITSQAVRLKSSGGENISSKEDLLTLEGKTSTLDLLEEQL